jgi:hypothetical protein
MATNNNNDNTSSNNNSFNWSDADVEVLLSAASEFKTDKEFVGIDWESVRNKYEEIGKRMAQVGVVITKERIAAKIKKIRIKYREAVDCGKRSGGGKIVAMNFKACSKLWGGCPAVDSIENGNYYNYCCATVYNFIQ